jgi:polyphosphate glucokinase
MKVLVVDVGGTHVKILATGQKQSRQFPSGPKLTAKQMVAGVKKLAGDWKYDVVSIGYPGPVLRGRPIAEPHNLAAGWVGFDYRRAFGCPVKVVNDAAMQALGSYRAGHALRAGDRARHDDDHRWRRRPMELGHHVQNTYEVTSDCAG